MLDRKTKDQKKKQRKKTVHFHKISHRHAVGHLSYTNFKYLQIIKIYFFDLK